jgi:predicted outer membrane protein
MQKNKVLKGLLAVSAVAAMLGAHGVQAQTTSSTPSATELQSQQGQAGQNLAGKSARDGAVDNTNSQGMEDRSGQVGSSTAGQTGSSSPTSTSSHGAAHQSGSTSGSAGMSGSTGTGAAGMSSQSSTQSGASGAAGATASASLSKADSKAVVDMAMANMAEVEAGKMAQAKGQSQEVKTFAQQMIDDHGKALQEVQTLAQSKGVTLPTELDAKHKAMAAKLDKLSGDAFDREYMKTGGLKAHKDTVAMLQKHQKNAKDADVKALATKMLPTVEQHLKAAQQMSSAKSGTTSGK